MDSITHVVVGAALGEAFAGRQLGKRAMLFGALAHSLPDIDTVSSLWMDPAQSLLAHRGFTHSLLFVAIITPIFAWLSHYWHRGHEMTLTRWMIFLGTCLMLHPLLDSLNSYGTGLFVPFNNARISLNTLFVADPFFTIWTFLAALALLVLKRFHKARRKLAVIALSLSLVYIGYAFANKMMVNATVKRTLSEDHIQPTSWFTTPAPLNAWLWYVVVQVPDGYYIGYRSVFDTGETMTFGYHAREANLLDTLKDKTVVQYLLRFARGYYTVDQEGSTLVFNDLRFGQHDGWRNLQSPFVFRFYLDRPSENNLVVQRGRFEGWDSQAFHDFITRIKGEKIQ